MPLFAPDRLAAWSRGRWTRVPAAPITGFRQDTRELRRGEAFVALKTERRDGHDFLAAAQAAGAAAAIVSDAQSGLTLPQLVVADPLAAFQAIAREHRRAFPRPVVAITGSAGKTSTKDLLAILLGGAPTVLATEGNLNNQLGVPLTLTRLEPAVHRVAVVEAGIGAPGEMEPLATMIAPDLVIVTLVSAAHLQALGDVEGVAREKARLVAAVRPDGLALFPRQCAGFAAFRTLVGPALVLDRVEHVNSRAPFDHRVEYAVTQRAGATLLDLTHVPPPPLQFTLRRVSSGMAQNAALAICAALRLGISPEVIQQSLVTWQPPRWRGELRRQGDRLLYLDCYNANPASMADALENFQAIAPAELPRLYLLGCMEELGPQSAEFHHRLGRSLRLRPEDRGFVIGGQAEALRAGLLEGGNQARQVEVVTDLAPVAGCIAGFRGAVFLKGSRLYQLERALPVEAPGEALVSC